MKASKIIIIVFSSLVLGLLIYKVKNYIPPRTPIKIARIESNLDLSNDSRIIDFEENYSFTGEGYQYLVVKLDSNEFKHNINECNQKNYKTLTIENLITDKFLDSDPSFGITLLKKDIKTIKGYYQLHANDLSKLDFGISVLDTVNKELIVYRCFP
ncbi:MAG TPA: hypothetical protein VF411_03860 [Bacteroidia bacterium]